MTPQSKTSPLGAWRPDDIPAFVEDYMKGDENFDLAKKHGGTPDTVKKFIRFLRETENLPTRDQIEEGSTFEYQGARDREKFIEFLQRGRSMPEIESMFGKELGEELLDARYPGLNLFTQLNNYSQRIYVLLREFTETLDIQPRVWSFHHSQSADSDGKQAYQLTQFPEGSFNEDGEIKLLPLFDVHYGHHTHKHNKFKGYIEYIRTHDNVFTWGGGDLIENALDDGRGMTYEQEFGPSTQIDRMCWLLAPIAHKILFLQPGNHEWRTYGKTGIDPTKVIADRLGVPYFDCPVFCSVLAGGHKWSIYSQHGAGHAQTKGGKMNAAGRPKKFIDGLNFLVSGHVHDPVVNAETIIAEDIGNCRLIYKQLWTVIAPSFLGFENTYAQRAGYGPPGAGGVSLHLYDNGDYEARLSNR